EEVFPSERFERDHVQLMEGCDRGETFRRNVSTGDHGQRWGVVMGAWILAGVTFREAARKRILWMALIAGLAFLALFGTGLHFQMKDLASRAPSLLLRRQILNAMRMMGLYAVDLLTVTMTGVTSVGTRAG